MTHQMIYKTTRKDNDTQRHYHALHVGVRGSWLVMRAHSTRLRCGHLLLAVLQVLAVLVVSLAVDSGHGYPDLQGSLGWPLRLRGVCRGQCDSPSRAKRRKRRCKPSSATTNVQQPNETVS